MSDDYVALKRFCPNYDLLLLLWNIAQIVVFIGVRIRKLSKMQKGQQQKMLLLKKNIFDNVPHNVNKHYNLWNTFRSKR